MKLFLILVLGILTTSVLFGQDGPASTKPRCRKYDRGPKITFKPKPGWPDTNGNLQGTVILRMELLATGNIGSVKVVKGLPLGATENAIKAADK